ncbi:MAG: pyridoxal-phosphate dependent enzyme [Polyangiaceae bacterium]|nr:pyridoxal-phosphate dependent enzyme [Polyangiaceae bacterium]
MTRAPLCLGTYPTPLERVLVTQDGRGELWLKDDSVTSPVYGGNKVRKLEHLLAEATARDARRLLTFGAAGSHHVYATSLFGLQQGFDVRAVLFPQPWSEHAEQMLRATLASGADCVASPAGPTAIPRVLRAWGRKTFMIPPGGSSQVGCRGYVTAAAELCTQLHTRELGHFDELVVSSGSCGTAAGLIVGLAGAGAPTRVIAAPVAEPAWGMRLLLHELVRRNGLRHGGAFGVDSRHTGRGYGYPSPGGQGSFTYSEKIGLTTDPTYTAKAFATALSRLDRGWLTDGSGTPTFLRADPLQNARREDETHSRFRVLYWHTLAAPTGAALQPTNLWTSPLPTDFQRLLVRV